MFKRPVIGPFLLFFSFFLSFPATPGILICEQPIFESYWAWSVLQNLADWCSRPPHRAGHRFTSFIFVALPHPHLGFFLSGLLLSKSFFPIAVLDFFLTKEFRKNTQLNEQVFVEFHTFWFFWCLAITWMNKLTFATLLFFSTAKILFRILTSVEIVNKTVLWYATRLVK